MAKRDYYDILGVTKKATADEIRKAHRKLALKYHPDRNAGSKSAEEKFKEVQEAYDILSDDKKRKQYDEFGHAGVGTAGAPPPGADPFEAFRRAQGQGGRGGYTQWRASPGVSVEDFDMGSMFEQLFGNRGGAESGRGTGGRSGRRARPEPPRGQDIDHPINLTFEQAARGITLPLQVSRADGGETIEVKIPAGVKDGSRIRIRGQGEQTGGEPGDIIIIAHVLPHAYFRRDGLDIFVEVPISMYEALLGTKVTVPTLDGQVTLTIPPGTSGGAKLRIKGQGIERAEEKGDQYVVVKVVVPKKIDEEDKAVIEKLALKYPVNARADLAW